MMQHLNESILGDCLKQLYPNETFIHDKVVPNSGIKLRPDYCCERMKLVVEFDGYHHFQKMDTILSDHVKNKTYTGMGYKVVRIPYFVQLSSETVKHYFNMVVDWPQSYPHGFVSKDALTPMDFNRVGYELYLKHLANLPQHIVKEIKESEDKRIEQVFNRRLLDVNECLL